VLPLTKQLTCSDLNLYFTDDFTTMTETPKTPTDQCIDMEETNIAHIAGVIDAVASITIHISREDSYAMGYRYKPMVRLYRPDKDSPLMGKLDAYCEDEGVNYSLSKEKREKSERVQLADRRTTIHPPVPQTTDAAPRLEVRIGTADV